MNSNCGRGTLLWSWWWFSHQVMSDSLQPHELYPVRLLSPWDSPGKNTAVGCHFLLQGIVSTQGSILGLLHCRWIIFFFFFSFIFISWRLITLQYYSGFCHTLTWISHGFTCIPHLDPCSHLPLHPIPLGLPSAPGPSTCLMHPAWAGVLFHPCRWILYQLSHQGSPYMP